MSDPKDGTTRQIIFKIMVQANEHAPVDYEERLTAAVNQLGENLHGIVRDLAAIQIQRQGLDDSTNELLVLMETTKPLVLCGDCGDPKHDFFCSKPHDVSKENWQKMTEEQRQEARSGWAQSLASNRQEERERERNQTCRIGMCPGACKLPLEHNKLV